MFQYFLSYSIIFFRRKYYNNLRLKKTTFSKTLKYFKCFLFNFSKPQREYVVTNSYSFAVVTDAKVLFTPFLYLTDG